jgi:hypothetical protein
VLRSADVLLQKRARFGDDAILKGRVAQQRRLLAKRVRVFIEWVTPMRRASFGSQDR